MKSLGSYSGFLGDEADLADLAEVNDLVDLDVSDADADVKVVLESVMFLAYFKFF